jgi:hypothetical protein
MKVLISTPLFPPEKNFPAPFSKLFAEHLNVLGNKVVVAAFVDYPEHVEGVKIIAVRKSENIILRLVKFAYSIFVNMKDQEVVVLKQAGISSCLTGIIAKIFGSKVVLIINEDEAEMRIIKQKVNPSSFLIKRVVYLQNIVFKLSDKIFFNTVTLKNEINSKYNLNKNKIFVLPQPKQEIYLPYDENTIELKKQNLDEWEKYISEFIKLTNQ